jgi:biotin operon repressor
MLLPRTERMIIILKKNPKGLTIKELIEQLNVKKQKDILNTISQLRRRGVNVDKNNGLYKLTDKKTPVNSLFNMLAANPDGILVEEIIDKLNITRNALSNRLWYLRKKGFQTVYENNKYRLSNTPSPSINKPRRIKKNFIKNDNSLIPKQYREVFLSLSDSDKTDCLDMLRKSLYYHKSAISLLESNQEVVSFIKEINYAEKN